MAYIEVTGLDDLIKKAENIAGPQVMMLTNAKIIKTVSKKVQATAKTTAPKSKDPWKSGRKGSRTGQHMATKIPLSAVKNNTAANAYAVVGWEKGDDSPYFYSKFIEWGTSKQPATAFLEKSMLKHKSDLDSLAEKEYNSIVKILE